MLRLLAVLAGLFVAESAQAQSWKARLALIPAQSAASCGEVPHITWDLKLQGGVFSGSSNQGAEFSSTVSPDGSVKASYRGNLGGGTTFPMELTGNVNTRQFELYSPTHSCRFTMVSK